MVKNKALSGVIELPSPVNISIWWNLGSMLGMLLGVQILTGLMLSMYYKADLVLAYSSVCYIMRDVPMGWIFRILHANTASIFFLALYIHLGRNLYYQSYKLNTHTWSAGVSIFILSMATAFMGYVLPWGQMSFWGATVITNLLSAIPYLGESLVIWIWGGYSVGGATLGRFYTLHFLLPFLILMMVLVHLFFLHESGSSNPLGEKYHVNKIVFHPYFTYKDFVGFIVLLFFITMIFMFWPYVMMDPENFIEANPMSTPVHIKPEWYFLFAYAILRSIPSKLGGVVALAMSLLILYVLPISKMSISKPACFSVFYQICFWVLVLTFGMLTWLGGCPIEYPYQLLASFFSLLYFFLFLTMMILTWLYTLFSSFVLRTKGKKIFL